MPLIRRDHDADQTQYQMREDDALILAVVVCIDQMSHD
jgi:hypothetical protein